MTHDVSCKISRCIGTDSQAFYGNFGINEVRTFWLIVFGCVSRCVTEVTDPLEEGSCCVDL